MRQKIKWRSVGIPEATFKRIQRVIVFTGQPSVSEYVREKVNSALTLDMMALEKFEEDRRELNAV